VSTFATGFSQPSGIIVKSPYALVGNSNQLTLINGANGAILSAFSSVGDTFDSITAMAFNRSDFVFVVDSVSSKVFMVTFNITNLSATVQWIAGSGVAGYQDGVGTLASFANPRGIAVLSSGDILISDTGNNAIRRISRDTFAVSTFAGASNASLNGSSFNGTSADAMDASYVLNGTAPANVGFGQVRNVSSTGNVTSVQLSSPGGIAVDAANNVYIADTGNNVIRVIKGNGSVSTLAGTSVSGLIDGSGSSAAFSGPTSLAFVAPTWLEPSGGLMIVDGNLVSPVVRYLRFQNNSVTTVAGACSQRVGNVDGVGTSACFSSISGIAVVLDEFGVPTVYLTDSVSNSVRSISVGVSRSVCPAGGYCPAGTGNVTGLPCPAGFYCNAGLANVSGAIVCGAGSHCPARSSSAAPCPAGSLCPSTPSASATRCPGGQYCNGTGLTSSLPCDVGQYCAPGSIVPSACVVGSYCPVAMLSAALNCSAGSYCPVTGMTAPLACELGDYCPSGSANTTNCTAGYYCTTPANRTLCPANNYCPVRSTDVTPCPADSTCLPGSSFYVICDAGFYCPYVNSPGIPCPGGSYCPKGVISPFPCPAGTYCAAGSTNISSAQNCSDGFWCPAGSANPSGSGPCPAGYYCVAGYDRQPCNAGRYNPFTGMSNCTVSSPGYFVPNVSMGYQYPISCPMGGYCDSFGMSEPKLCVAGYYCSSSGLSVSGNPCQPGNYCPNGTSYMFSCPTGSFCPASGMSAPKLCPAGFYCPMYGASMPYGLCSAGSYCPPGSVNSWGVSCTAGYLCPAGSPTIMGGILATGVVTGVWGVSYGSSGYNPYYPSPSPYYPSPSPTPYYYPSPSPTSYPSYNYGNASSSSYSGNTGQTYGNGSYYPSPSPTYYPSPSPSYNYGNASSSSYSGNAIGNGTSNPSPMPPSSNSNSSSDSMYLPNITTSDSYFLKTDEALMNSFNQSLFNSSDPLFNVTNNITDGIWNGSSSASGQPVPYNSSAGNFSYMQNYTGNGNANYGNSSLNGGANNGGNFVYNYTAANNTNYTFNGNSSSFNNGTNTSSIYRNYTTSMSLYFECD
jgi:hypothetical protein